MRLFKPGDKVRFREDGEIGKHNKEFMYAYQLKYEFTVVYVYNCGNVQLYCENEKIKQDWVTPIQIELVPEPQPKLDNIKVGDWVELIYDNGCKYHCEVIQVGCSIVVIFDGSKTYFDVNGFELNKCENDNAFEITRILSPKEVVVDFGSGIKGTVSKTRISTYSQKDYFYILLHTGLHLAMPFEALDQQTRAIVESLLKAQED